MTSQQVPVSTAPTRRCSNAAKSKAHAPFASSRHGSRQARRGTDRLFIEGGDEPRPGVQVQPWGPERITEKLLGLLDKYDNVLLPPPGV